MSIRFGEFTFDPERRQLSRGCQVMHLSPKAFELLRTLLDCRPRAISKAELLERVWPGTFVSEANLTTVVYEVRAALGDRRGLSQYVRTVHGFGYAFDADVAAVGGDEEENRHGQVTFWLITGTHQIQLTDGENIIGRDPHLPVCLDAPSVSRHHARIVVVAADRVTIQDLESKNGTFVRGDRVSASARELLDGDLITVGSVDVRFRVWSVGGRTTETQHA